jgi:hypothetical protein
MKMKAISILFAWAALATLGTGAAPGSSTDPEAGLAVRDITPDYPIRLAGYASRNRPAGKTDGRLLVQALALKNPSGERFVLVSLDNCEVSRAFMAPVLQELQTSHKLLPGEVAIVSSHTHSAPVLADTLVCMGQPPAADQEAINKYSAFLRKELVAVVAAALADCRDARFEYGCGQAKFAMNRRVYRGGKVVFGDNPDGPVDWDVPVLRIKDSANNVRAVLFGYACHGTSVRTGDDWYVVSGEYMAYARDHLQALVPGASALYVPGMGADSDPAPRGLLLDAKRHGLELAGAVMGVLDRPMRPVRGGFKLAFKELDLPLAEPPTRKQIEDDSRSEDPYIRERAKLYLKMADGGEPWPRSVKLPVSALRLGDDLTFVLMAGEVVVDYSKRLKRLLAADYPWPIAYAYEVPCYIPSSRIVKEGGYEAESSLIYYGYYGPLRAEVEDVILSGVNDLVAATRARP